MRQTFVRPPLLAVALSAVLSSSVNAAIIFIDDFSDGDAVDGTPVSWAPSEFHGGGSFEVVDRELIISVGDWVMLMIPQIPLLERVSFRWQARVLNFPPSQGYWLQIAYGDDETVTRYAGRLYRKDAETEGRLDTLIDWTEPYPAITALVDLDPHLEDVVLQLDVFDSTVSYWAWKAGEPMPSEPFAQLTDSHIAAGKIGVEFGPADFQAPPSPVELQMAVRYVAVSDTPLRVDNLNELFGDFNSDGMVDGGDLIDWQRRPAVGNLAIWEENYGTAADSNESLVPEPHYLWGSAFVAFALSIRKPTSGPLLFTS